jgi:hypothetical protein
MSKFSQHANDDERDDSVDPPRLQAERLRSKSFKQQSGQFGKRRSAPAGYNGIHRRRRRRLDW